MMKKLTIFLSALCLMAALTISAGSAGPLIYDIAAPGNPEYGRDTSIEIVHTADNGAAKNEDVSKNAALIPPAFGSPSADALNTGTPLTPNLAPGYMPDKGAVINGGAGITAAPPDFGNSSGGGTAVLPSTSIPTAGCTEVASGLCYKDGCLATLKIPSIGVNVKVYQGTGSSVLAKGAGHFPHTSMLWMLEQNPNLQSVALCLDHDEAGIEASGRLADLLHEHGYDRVGMLQPDYKDWNEDLKARHGLEIQPAEEHPQLIAAAPVCRRVAALTENARPERLGGELDLAVRRYLREFRAGRVDSAMGFLEQASALALFAYGRERRQMGRPMTEAELEEQLRSRILPHRNKGSIQTRHNELAARAEGVLAKAAAPGIRGEAEKEALAESWLELAVSLAKIPVKYDADLLKQRQKQEAHAMRMEAVMCSSM